MSERRWRMFELQTGELVRRITIAVEGREVSMVLTTRDSDQTPKVSTWPFAHEHQAEAYYEARCKGATCGGCPRRGVPRHRGPGRNRGGSPVSGGLSCKKREHRQFWVVLTYKANHSAFNGGRRTASAYSEVECPLDGVRWRTKAAYVDQLHHVGIDDAHGHELKPGDRVAVGTDMHPRTGDEAEVILASRRRGHDTVKIRFDDGCEEELLAGNIVPGRMTRPGQYDNSTVVV